MEESDNGDIIMLDGARRAGEDRPRPPGGAEIIEIEDDSDDIDRYVPAKAPEQQGGEDDLDAFDDGLNNPPMSEASAEPSSGLAAQAAEEGLRLLRESAPFWGLDDRWMQKQVSTGRETHKVPGLRVALMAHQLEAVWRALHRALEKGIFAVGLFDTMGLGKTYQAIALAAVRTLLHDKYEEVKANDRMRGGAHLSEQQRREILRSGKHVDCPSGTYSSGFACPCVPTRPSFELVRAGVLPRGPVILLLPPSLCEKWIRELSGCLSHSPMPGTGKTFEVRCLYRKLAREQSPIVKYYQSAKLAIQDVESPCEFVEYPGRVLDGVKKLSNQGMSKDNHIFFVLPASNGLSSILEETRDIRPDPDDPTVSRDASFSVSPGLVVVDEAHIVKNETTILWKFVGRLTSRSRNPVFLVSITGTPLQIGPADLTSFVVSCLVIRAFHWGSPKSRPPGGREEARKRLEEWKKLSHSLVTG